MKCDHFDLQEMKETYIPWKDVKAPYKRPIKHNVFSIGVCLITGYFLGKYVSQDLSQQMQEEIRKQEEETRRLEQQLQGKS